MIKNPLNEFIAEYIESKYKYKIKLIQPAFTLFFLLGYYTWLFLEFVRRGFVINKARKDYKLSKECAYGFYRKTVRDDIMIDNNRFKKEDVIFLELDDKFYKRIENFKNAREKGLHTDSVPKMKINITGNIFSILFFYFIVPLKAYYYLMLDRKTYLLYYILQFHKKALSIELLMNLYRIKCHISTKDWGDVAETIVLNKYGTKNIIFHWSDLTSYESYDLAFMAHNVYFVWGDIHYNYQSANSFVDEKVNIGCIFKESYNRALRDKENITSAMIGFRKEAKTVVFCDTSFGDLGEYSEEFFIKYMEIIKEFCEKNGNINILLKPKHGRDMVLQLLESNLGRYEKIWKGLSGLRNFIYIDPQKWSVEEVIAISDICVNMGMDSPSTIALICGKNGLYFNNMGNIYHPFAKKYKNILVFDEKDLLFRQMNNILDGKIHYRDVISEREIREYDTFDDDKALERLRENIYELTL